MVVLIGKGDMRGESPVGIKGQDLVVQIHPYWTGDMDTLRHVQAGPQGFYLLAILDGGFHHS